MPMKQMLNLNCNQPEILDLCFIKFDFSIMN